MPSISKSSCPAAMLTTGSGRVMSNVTTIEALSAELPAASVALAKKLFAPSRPSAVASTRMDTVPASTSACDKARGDPTAISSTYIWIESPSSWPPTDKLKVTPVSPALICSSSSEMIASSGVPITVSSVKVTMPLSCSAPAPSITTAMTSFEPSAPRAVLSSHNVVKCWISSSSVADVVASAGPPLDNRNSTTSPSSSDA